MIKKTITYTDYNGRERTEDFWFHLNKAEMMEMNLSKKGGLQAYIEMIIKTEEHPELVKIFKDLILKSYGVKDIEGKRFIKNEELTTAFTQTEAYSELFMELSTDADAAAVFIKGVMPKDLADQVNEKEIMNNTLQLV